MTFENTLFYGDCLNVLKDISAESVDLIYLDPPFNSQRDYNAFFTSKDGKQSQAQIMAFEDTWHWGEQAQREYDELLKNPNAGSLAETIMPALRAFLAQSDMMAYLVMMASRLVELKRVLKSTGSLYLHCDPTASHYLKIMLDGIFGQNNLCNEIIWHYKRWPTKALRFQRMHDIILFYKRSNKNVFNILYQDPTPSSLKRWKGKKIKSTFDETGKRLPSQSEDVDSIGVPMDDVWDIPIIAPVSSERLGYPTQKPLALLERIIKASSNPGDVILDPFCGCGTAIHAAQKLGRKWIGIDITHLAVGLIKRRMHSAFPETKFKVSGTPQDVDAARFLAESNGLDGRYQFQYWALSLVDGIASQDKKKGADNGSDGFIWAYNSPTAKKPFKINISVKSGKIPTNHIRELGGMLGKNDVEVCLLITLENPSSKMSKDALSYGDYEYPNGKKFKRIQILTIKDLLEGKQPQFMDFRDGAAMPKKAKRESKEISQESLI